MFKLLLLIAMFWVLGVRAQAPLFTPAPGSPVAVGEGSGLIVLADVNRDGKLDLITQHLMQEVVAVQLGDGTGRFAMAQGSPMKLAYSPGDTKLGDVNGDGMLDLGVSRSERDSVDIFLGNGSGKFSPAPGSPFTVSASNEANTHGLYFLDLNEDGKLDLITINNLQNSFGSMLGDGRGGFAAGPKTTFPAGQGRYAFTFGDLDGDKHLDVAIANSGNGEFAEPTRVVVLRGDGKGAFNKLSETSVLLGPRYVTQGDMNGDGRPDLVLVAGSNEHCGVGVLLNQGGGKFTPGASYDLGTSAFGAAVADVNQDKRNDLVVATVDSVTVLLNVASGFAPAPGSPYRAGPGAYHLPIGDVNQDGKPDVAASSFGGKTATVLLGR